MTCERNIEQKQLSITGLRAAYATDTVARADFDAVSHDAAKLRTHLEDIRIECEFARGRNRG